MNFLKKWYTYQKERFPVLAMGTYILSIVFGVFCYINRLGLDRRYELLKNAIFFKEVDPYVINYWLILPMFAVAFLQFLMVRIIDEFKDYEEDCKYRPYRPVPRGLIKLKELGVLFAICAVLQVGITAYVNVKSLYLLGLLWIVFALMTKGFFIKKIIDKHMLLEVIMDELMMPAMVLYLASLAAPITSGIWKILLMFYIISGIIEVARKVRCKEDEENGVRTYTAVFGIKRAMLILFSFDTLLMSVQSLILGTKYLAFTIGTYVVLNIVNFMFVTKQTRKYAKMVELLTNLYVIIVAVSMWLLIK